MKKDALFAQENSPSIFRFDHHVASVFDDMLSRSVPFYHEVIRMTGQILETLLQSGDTVYDLGCSTGGCTLVLAEHFTSHEINFIGLDNSPAMLEKAEEKLAEHQDCLSCRFAEGDLTSFETENAGAIIINYTMQFIKPAHRLEVLKKIHSSLRPGGCLIFSEKIKAHDHDLSQHFAHFHEDFKRYQGYSEIEISKKRQALENVLIPLTISENINLLKQSGFTRVETFFQWYNFVSYMAVKNETSRFGK